VVTFHRRIRRFFFFLAPHALFGHLFVVAAHSVPASLGTPIQSSFGSFFSFHLRFVGFQFFSLPPEQPLLLTLLQDFVIQPFFAYPPFLLATMVDSIFFSLPLSRSVVSSSVVFLVAVFVFDLAAGGPMLQIASFSRAHPPLGLWRGFGLLAVLIKTIGPFPRGTDSSRPGPRPDMTLRPLQVALSAGPSTLPCPRVTGSYSVREPASPPERSRIP